ncbi:MAG: hypothetical protein QMC45_08095, partial [Patiriisocius sp.]
GCIWKWFYLGKCHNKVVVCSSTINLKRLSKIIFERRLHLNKPKHERLYIFNERLIQIIITSVIGATFFKDEDLC